MHIVQLSMRLTFKYVPGWSGLDEWEPICDAKLTPPKVVAAADGYDTGCTVVQWTRLPKGIDRETFRRAVEQTLSGSHCRHEHDCCGCASYSADAVYVSKRDLLVRTSTTFNY